MILRLALTSLRARLLTVSLTVATIALSVILLLGVETVRTGARASFADTISGTDLIVGARSSSVQLMLYTVFGIGSPTNNIGWDSIETIEARPEVDWLVPISLGDSHGNFRVLGTTAEFFERYSYRGNQALAVAEGAIFADIFDVVIGAEVAESLGYGPGDPLVIAHGIASFSEHEDHPFRVSGVLERSGTPLDRSVITSLAGLEAIHVDWRDGAQRGVTPADTIRQMDLTPGAVTAALVGIESRLQLFNAQRWINEYPDEALSAVLPGLALQELWQIVGVAESALLGVSIMVVATAIVGMVALIFSSLNERRREMAILRAVGARPAVIMGLLVLEATLTSLAGVTLGTMLVYAALWLGRPMIDANFGLWLPISAPSSQQWLMLTSIVAAAVVASLLPALRAYRLSLVDGMMVKS